MYDILVKGGEVIDPSQGIHGKCDIGISNGKIAAIETEISDSAAQKVIDTKGNIVVPGLIDIHAHPAEGLADVGVNPDQYGVKQGVTTTCDGGTLGCYNFAAARMYINPRSETDVFWFIHVCNTGQVVIPEVHGWFDIDQKMTLKIIEENRDIIRGVKFRAIGSAAQNIGVEGAKMVKKIANEARLPLMIHLGACFSEIGVPGIAESVEPYTVEVLRLLEKGDIITHIYTPKAGGMIKFDGTVLPEFKEAMERGVLLDIGHGGTNFSVEIAKIGIAQGILPYTISTDASTVTVSRTAEKGMAKIIRSGKTSNNIKDPEFSLAAIMSKHMALGLTLEQVIEMTTTNPAKILSEDQRIGSLKVGRDADVAILQMLEQDVLFPDRISDVRLEGKNILIPKLTLKSRKNKVNVITAA